jgi:hypothetical protein
MPTLYLIPDLTQALEKKIERGCPHIHLQVEPSCSSFTLSLLWAEVIYKGVEASKSLGECVLSFPSIMEIGTDEEEIALLRKASTLLSEVDVVYVE